MRAQRVCCLGVARCVCVTYLTVDINDILRAISYFTLCLCGTVCVCEWGVRTSQATSGRKDTQDSGQRTEDGGHPKTDERAAACRSSC